MANRARIFHITLRMLLLLIAVSAIAFILIAKAPIDPLAAYVGTESTLSQEAKDAAAAHWGLDKSLPERYFTWVGNVLRLDLGESITYKRPVADIIGERFSHSVVLMLLAWVLSGLLGFALGAKSASLAGRLPDKIIKSLCLVLQSTPVFWIGLLALSLFAVTLGWFPIGMEAPIGKLAQEVTFWDRAYHLILPVFTLTIIGVGKIALYTRQKYIEVMGSDFVLFAKARGETKRQLFRRHILRNIALPAVTIQFASFSELFGGMTLAETVFSFPGIGSATTAAALNGDVPLLLGTALIGALFVFAGNLTANILYGVFDPRLKDGGEYV
ncbi:MAG: ABC transporter permease [Clostridiales Family XIII bacterium]|jgi:peptide/nickel transport system permease protein|nr:ABC transporter permease [Clostridiales Family XIII bacterium]